MRRVLVGAVFLLAACQGVDGHKGHPPSSDFLPKDAVGIGVVMHYESISDAWVVSSVWPGSPAEESGVKQGDHIRSLAGVELPLHLGAVDKVKCTSADAEKTQRLMEASTPVFFAGQVIAIQFERNGGVQDASVATDNLRHIYDRALATNKVIDAGCFACYKAQCWFQNAGYESCDPCYNNTCRTV